MVAAPERLLITRLKVSTAAQNEEAGRVEHKLGPDKHSFDVVDFISPGMNQTVLRPATG